MSKIVDIICTKPAGSPFFDVNTAVDTVIIQHVGLTYLYNALVNRGIVKGDNINLISVGYVLPLSFELYTEESTGIAIDFQAQSIIGGVFHKFSELDGEKINVPLPNTPNYMNAFLDCEKNGLLTGDFSLVSDIFSGSTISMNGVPATLNTKRFYIKIFAQIEHNLPMYVIPE